MKIDKKSFVVGAMSVSAALLAFAHLNLNSVALASEAVQGRDFQLVTARIIKGGDALYILDKKTRYVGIFTWDNAAKSVIVRDVRNMDDLMGVAAPAVPTR